MPNDTVFRVRRDPVGWTVAGDRQPRSYTDKARAIERAIVLVERQRPCVLLVLDDNGEVEEERKFE